MGSKEDMRRAREEMKMITEKRRRCLLLRYIYFICFKICLPRLRTVPDLSEISMVGSVIFSPLNLKEP